MNEFNQIVYRKDGKLNGKRTNRKYFESIDKLDIWNDFEQRSSHLNTFSIRDKIFLLNNGYSLTPPVCEQCGKNVKVDQNTVHKFCSLLCASLSEKTKKRRKTTSMQRFGVSVPSKNEEVRKRISETFREKSEEEKQSIQKKRTRTNIKKYGVSVASKNEEVRKRTQKTNLKKYGTEYGLQNEEVKRKIAETNRKNHEGRHNFQFHLTPSTISQLGDRDWLLNEYSTKSASQIAKEIGCGYLVVINRLRAFGVEEIKKSYNVSSYENILYDFLTEHGFEVERSNRSLLSGKEIDLYIPQFKLGIEFNGIYWHSLKPKNHLVLKTNLATEKGISLVHLNEHDIDDEERFRKIKSILLNKLNKTENRLFARKLALLPVSKKEQREFLKENHLQRPISSKICLGLYNNEELVQIVSFGKPRFNKNFEWELLRSASKLNTTIVGGFERLIKSFNSTSIISYVDRLYFNGMSYFKNWEFLGSTSPGYYWTNGKEVLSRYQCQRRFLKGDGTEDEIMQKRGFYKNWNCGNLIFKR